MSPSCVCSECFNKHMGPVWELKWIQQEVTLTGDEKVEALFSVAADGRICKWLLCNNGLDCIGTTDRYQCEPAASPLRHHPLIFACRPDEAQQGAAHQEEEDGAESRVGSFSSDVRTVF